MSSTSSAPETVKQTHLLRGILWGIPFGLGLAIVLLVTKVIPLTPGWVLGVFVGGVVIGALWSILGPAKSPKGPPPAAPSPPPGDTTGTPETTDPAVADAPSSEMPPPPPDVSAGDA